MTDNQGDSISAAIEALLLMSTVPVSTFRLAEALDQPVDQIERRCLELQQFYTDTGRGFELRNVGGGWRLWTRPEHAEVLSAWVLEGQHARLSQPALETLAVIAYLQPISRARISAVRGVNVDGVVRTLLTRGLIEETGAEDATPGGAVLFATSDHFLERMGMESLSDLPPLAPHLPDASALEAELARVAQVEELAPEPLPTADQHDSEDQHDADDAPDAAVAPSEQDSHDTEHAN